MSGGKINTEVLAAMIDVQNRSTMVSLTRPGFAIEAHAFNCLRKVTQDVDAHELVDDILSVAARLTAVVIRSTHGGDLCPSCIAESVFQYSLEVAAELSADDAAREADEEPETPPFSGSIN